MKQENIVLELHIDYIIKDEAVTILSCKGYGTKVALPERINGYPVKVIGAYAFSDPERSLEMVSDGVEIYSDKIPGMKVPGCNDEYIYGKRLQEIVLPDSMEVIDRYAFYNCKELITIHIPGGLIKIEDGAFMNCEKLAFINVNAEPEDLTSVRGILTELTSELCITFTNKDVLLDKTAVFLFPEYYEYSVENTPARVFHYQLYGAGFRYRQCFVNGRLNIMAYDTVFQSPEIQTIYETALRIAFLRIQYPYDLHESMKNQYFNYIAMHIEKALKLIIEQENTKGLMFLVELGIMTEKNYIDAGEMAVRTGHKECAGILLKERLRYYPPKEKTYEL